MKKYLAAEKYKFAGDKYIFYVIKSILQADGMSKRQK